MKRITFCILLALSLALPMAISAQSFPPAKFPATVKVMTDAGVAQFWNVKRIMCLGKTKGGYKFRIFGQAEATTGSRSIEMFYILPGNKLQSAGAYIFPEISKGEPFQFDIVSAFTYYAPAKFLGFMILDENLKVEEQAIETPPAVTLTEEIIVSSHNEDEKALQPEVEDDDIYDKVETEPSFPGGISAIFTHIAKNMRYPLIAAENGIQGKVIVSFVIEKNGSISNVIVTKGVNPDLDKEAVRVVKTLPKFSSPGKINGKPKRTKMNLPVNFRLK